ncbi:MAG TPA: TIGR04282 family arsenosugar biosynthesis glycosyltransferase [Blastocatellia bacterium]|nr:TIGR04282 family arsenosugar biosynthesis glycosyltransferase [Blastocatellia bacterium]
MLKLMQRPGERLIIFTRYPEPGRAKTRLIPALGAEGAADLHRRLTERTLATARRLATLRRLTLEVRYAGGDAALMRQWLGGGPHLRAQGDGDLGARMREAFREAFEEGCYGVVLIGTDCPDIAPATLLSAFTALGDNELVMGPARDGGYYLIGLRRAIPQLFEGINWGTDTVLRHTLQIAARLDLRYRLLEQLDDIDRPEDLRG